MAAVITHELSKKRTVVVMAENEDAECPNNVRLFRIAVSNSLRNIAESVSETEFIGTLTILESSPSIARKLHQAMVEELYKRMNDDLEDMMAEGSLRDVLLQIAKLSEESITSGNKDVWRPPGDIASHMRSLDAHEIKQATEKLEKQVNEMERDNETLMRTIAEGRSRLEAMDECVTKILNRAPVVLQRLEKTYVELVDCFKEIDSE